MSENKIHISAKNNFLKLELTEIPKNWDLLLLMIERDFKASYKQTILGPLWFFVQPIINSFVYLIVFSKIIGVNTGSQNPILFYMSGVIFWNLFSSSLTINSNILMSNSRLFSKVYFPRIIVPMSIILSSYARFTIQLIFLYIFSYFVATKDFQLNIGEILVVIITSIFTSLFGTCLGLLVASITTKYRDLIHLTGFGLQLILFATPILYPFETLTNEYKEVLSYNPLTALINSFRASLFSTTESFFHPNTLISCMVITLLFITSCIVYTAVSKNFIDRI